MPLSGPMGRHGTRPRPTFISSGDVSGSARVGAMNYYDAVTQGGLDNTGATSVTSGILTCISAYKAAGYSGLYFPAGHYQLNTDLIVPDGTRLVGWSMTDSHLRGHVDFGSNSFFVDLRIGDIKGKSAIHNVNGASTTSFTRCHFRGGGNTAGDQDNKSVVCLGSGDNTTTLRRDCDHITFTDCEVECNYGTENASRTIGYNNIFIIEQGAHVHDITFDGCHIGVTNGVRSGSPRMGIEVWTTTATEPGWENIIIRDCIFEVTDCTTINLANSTVCQASGGIIHGNTIKGAGRSMGDTTDFGYGICLEWPENVSVTNNTIYRCGYAAIWHANVDNLAGMAYQYTGNVINYDIAYDGVSAGNRCIVQLEGDDVVFTGNTITVHNQSGLERVIEIDKCTGATVTGNTLNIDATKNAVAIVQYIPTNSGNTVTPNTVVNP